MEEIQSRHRKEQQDLQARITQKKKNATKKTRKGVNDECETLQRELQERQQAEMSASDPASIVTMIEYADVGSKSADTGIEGEEASENTEAADKKSEKTSSSTLPLITSRHVSQTQPKKLNRQKARLARRAAEQEAQALQAAEEAADLPDLREQEIAAMRQQMDKRGLTEINIRPDGHCLYSAIAAVVPPRHLPTNPEVKPYQIVRTTTAEFISEHPDDFSAFLEESIETYVNKIKQTAEWGGQLELQAIARAYGVRIHVLQANGRIEKIEPDTEPRDPPVWLAYYLHSFGLGEHYNALKTS